VFDGDVAAVPGESGVRRMSLRAPRLVGADLLPARVIDGGIGPGEIVSEVELPLPVERDGASAGVLHDDGPGKGGRRERAKCKNQKQAKPTAAGNRNCHAVPPFGKGVCEVLATAYQRREKSGRGVQAGSSVRGPELPIVARIA